MSDASNAVKNLRERLTGASEDHLGKALSDLLDNPLLTGTIGRAFDAREKAAQAQELAMGVLNIPSAADIERLTRRLRSVSQRLEGIEDGVHRLDSALAAHGVESRLSKIEEQLGTITKKLGGASQSGSESSSAPKPSSASKPLSASKSSKPRARRSPASTSAAKPSTRAAKPKKR
jgi:hypothetical protein